MVALSTSGVFHGVFKLMLLEGLLIEELIMILTRPVIASVNLLVLVSTLMSC